MIDIVAATPEHDRPTWWPDVVHGLRVHAATGDVFFDVTLHLEECHQPQLADLYERAAGQVMSRASVSADEAGRRLILDDLPVIFRGSRPVDTVPAAQLGHALAAPLRGTLPTAPPGTTWYYGTPEGPGTIGG